MWHSQTNPWFFEDATRDRAAGAAAGITSTRSSAATKARSSGWDVVNEAINDGGTGDGAPRTCANHRGCRSSAPTSSPRRSSSRAKPTPPWRSTTTTTASRAAPSTRARCVLLKRLIAEGAPITTVGIQGHWSLTDLTPQKYRRDRAGDRTLQGAETEIAITELDVTVTGTGGGQLGAARRLRSRRRRSSCARRRTRTPSCSRIFVKHRDAIDRVTFWGLSDRRSWRRTSYPLVFDADCQPKPALQAIVDAVTRAKA